MGEHEREHPDHVSTIYVDDFALATEEATLVTASARDGIRFWNTDTGERN